MKLFRCLTLWRSSLLVASSSVVSFVTVVVDNSADTSVADNSADTSAAILLLLTSVVDTSADVSTNFLAKMINYQRVILMI